MTGIIITVFDGFNHPKEYRLDSFNKSIVTFGHLNNNDIIIDSMLCSREHGRFMCSKGNWYIEDHEAYGKRSTNGLIFNGSSLVKKQLLDGDIIRIGDRIESREDGVLIVVSFENSVNKWHSLDISNRNEIKIGRDQDSDIKLISTTVSRHHATIKRIKGKFIIFDSMSTNGVYVNDKLVTGKMELMNNDIIIISNTKLLFGKDRIYYCSFKNGMSVDAHNIVYTMTDGTLAINNVSLSINPGDMVAFVGCSGAGKSTLLNILSGYIKPQKGNVYINGVDIYNHFDEINNSIGYVPQSNVLYDNLTVKQSLEYSAKMRLSKDTSSSEVTKIVNRVLNEVSLNHREHHLVRNLSGGEKKRLSMAMELIPDPSLIFMDEPTSGLDPGTEIQIIELLTKISNSGKTIIMVTHDKDSFKFFDKIVFLGKGGNLCYYGSYSDACSFFNVSEINDKLYNNELRTEPMKWRNRYEQTITRSQHGVQRKNNGFKRKESGIHQLPILFRRCFRLLINDWKKPVLYFLVGPALVWLTSLLKTGNEFKQYESSKTILFILTCICSWIGMFNSIQEIVGEKDMVKREYMTGLSLNSYVASKVLYFTVICFIQSVSISFVFKELIGLHDTGLLFDPFLELLITCFLTVYASTATGLLISSLFDKADKATLALILAMIPQILFSGILFDLNQITEKISYFIISKWSMAAYGASADLNQLPLRLQEEGIMVSHKCENIYEHSAENIIEAWILLMLFTVALSALTRIAVMKFKRKNGWKYTTQ